MGQGFIIMQIGDAELDRMCEEVMVPALKVCGLNPKRVDKHNKGELLKSEIVRFIREAEIVIADLTNERPNCYLEVGYTMGVGKNSRLILTAREDHREGSPSHRLGGPKVHFDLGGYDILFWDPADLGSFRLELEKRIRRRLAIPKTVGTAATIWDSNWISAQNARASADFINGGFPGALTVWFALDEKVDSNQKELMRAAREAQLHGFGWPIGIVLEDEASRPRPTPEGIMAQVKGSAPSYDYWSIKKNGDFFLLKNLFEDEQRPDKPGFIFVGARIVRTAEIVLYCERLYRKLGAAPDSLVHISMTYSGLRGRRLASDAWISGECSEIGVGMSLDTTLAQLRDDMVGSVQQLTRELFILFDFFEARDDEYLDQINQFLDRCRLPRVKLP